MLDVKHRIRTHGHFRLVQHPLAELLRRLYPLWHQPRLAHLKVGEEVVAGGAVVHADAHGAELAEKEVKKKTEGNLSLRCFDIVILASLLLLGTKYQLCFAVAVHSRLFGCAFYIRIPSIVPSSFIWVGKMHSEKCQINGHKHFFSKLVYVGTNLVLGNENVCKREVIQK